MSYRQDVYKGNLYEVTITGPGRFVRYHNKGFRGQSAERVAVAFANAYPGEGQVIVERKTKSKKAKRETATARRPHAKPKPRSDWRYDD